MLLYNCKDKMLSPNLLNGFNIFNGLDKESILKTLLLCIIQLGRHAIKITVGNVEPLK